MFLFLLVIYLINDLFHYSTRFHLNIYYFFSSSFEYLFYQKFVTLNKHNLLRIVAHLHHLHQLLFIFTLFSNLIYTYLLEYPLK
jgi:hypothetical protein